MLDVNIEKILPVTEVRDSLNKIIDEVESSDEMYVITKNGKPSAILVGVHHMEKLTGLSHKELIPEEEPVQEEVKSEEPAKVEEKIETTAPVIEETELQTTSTQPAPVSQAPVDDFGMTAQPAVTSTTPSTQAQDEEAIDDIFGRKPTSLDYKPLEQKDDAAATFATPSPMPETPVASTNPTPQASQPDNTFATPAPSTTAPTDSSDSLDDIFAPSTPAVQPMQDATTTPAAPVQQSTQTPVNSQANSTMPTQQ